MAEHSELGEMHEEALRDVVRRLNERVASVHERVACPRCLMRVGKRCVRAAGRGLGAAAGARTLKHPHRERLRADGIYER